MSVAELPLTLRTWKNWLGWFDVHLAEQLGDLLLRLSDLIGPAPAIASHAALEPDGLDDLRSRGSYERLLSSEWLLADEIPDEFLRRAVSSEHLFLSPRLRGARIERSVVAIFDAGPLQLGSARLAHIAAWILLARRAATAGGVLRWGVLQAPGTPSFAESVEDLQALLAARQMGPAGAAQFEQWRAACAGLDGEVETWWIGANPPPEFSAAASARERRLILRPGLKERTLEVTLESGARVRQAELPLPADRTAKSLLRGEFSALKPSAAAVPTHRNSKARRIALVRPPLFSFPVGHVGVATLAGHAMQVLALPRAGQTKLAAPRLQQWSSARQPLAAMLAGGQAAAVCSDGNFLQFWQVERFGVRPRPEPRQFEATIAAAHWLPMACLTAPVARRICVIDRVGRLVAWDGRNGKGGAVNQEELLQQLPTVFDKDVLAMMPLSNSVLAYVVQHEGGLWLRELEPLGHPSALVRKLCDVPGSRTRVFMAARQILRWHRQYNVGAVAVCTEGQHETWQVHVATDEQKGLHAADRSHVYEFTLAAGERACGVVAGFEAELPALIVQGVDQRKLFALTPAGRTLLHSESSRNLQCSVCPHSGLVAMLTNARDLLVLDTITGQMRLALRDAELVVNADAREDVQVAREAADA